MKKENSKLKKDDVTPLIATQADEYDEMVAYKTLRDRRKKKALIRILVYALMIILIPIFVFFTIIVVAPSNGQNIFGYTFYILETESMEPELMVGDCIVTQKINSPSDIKVGNDISFVRESDGKVVTHRVAEIQQSEEGYFYVTRGINNPNDDTNLVNFNNVLGVRVANLAFLGQTVTFFRTPIGVVLMVAVFISLILGFIFSFKMSEDIRAIGK